MSKTVSTEDISYPVSFRRPLAEVREIDAALTREALKRRADLMAAVWDAAWKEYKSSGSLEAYREGKRRRYSRRVSEELQDRLHIALDAIFERAPNAVIDDIAEYLTKRAGRYAESK